MGWESSDVFRFDLGPLSRLNDGSLALVSCLFGGYKFASVLRCIGLVSRKSIYPIFSKFGMGVYWVNSLHAIAFGEESCIAE